MPKRTFLTIEEVAKILQIGERSVYRFIEAKELKATKIGGWRITRKDLQDFIKSKTNIHKTKKKI